MALYYNNTNIATSNSVFINNQSQNKVYYNNNLVWSKISHLFNGRDNTAVTGGWATKKVIIGLGEVTPTVGSDSLAINVNGTSNMAGYIYTNNKIDVTSLNTISANVSFDMTVFVRDTNVTTWGVEKWGIGLRSSVPDESTTHNSFVRESYLTATSRNPQISGVTHVIINAQTKTINVSDLSGSYYVVLFCEAYDAYFNFPITTTQILVT